MAPTVIETKPESGGGVAGEGRGWNVGTLELHWRRLPPGPVTAYRFEVAASSCLILHTTTHYTLYFSKQRRIFLLSYVQLNRKSILS